MSFSKRLAVTLALVTGCAASTRPSTVSASSPVADADDALPRPAPTP